MPSQNSPAPANMNVRGPRCRSSIKTAATIAALIAAMLSATTALNPRHSNFLQALELPVVLIWCQRREMEMNGKDQGLAAVLHADTPDSERAEALQLYGQFVGDWDAAITSHGEHGAEHHSNGEIRFGWVLEGRAIQDVWMIPRLSDRKGARQFPIAGNWYGTTLRVFDPTLDAWRIYWIDPATNSFRQQIGRARGPDIVQEGTTESGGLSRWSFTAITNRSFHWLGEAKPAGSSDWRLFVEVEAQRRKSS
jgi:hypothetical protein